MSGGSSLPSGYKPPTSVGELCARYDLGERYFRGAKLPGGVINRPIQDADFRDLQCGANFTFGEADFVDCNFAGATLDGSGWWDVSMQGCDLTGASLDYAHVWASDFRSCTLRNVSLRHAIVEGCGFAGCDCSGAMLAETTFLDVDLGPFGAAAPPVQHQGPSYVDYRTVLASVRTPALRDFLVRLGTPPVFAEYMVQCARSLKEDVFSMMQSTFISYGSPDEAFARRLYEALHRNGVTTFFFPEHARPGQRLHRTMREGVNNYDRVILVCSRGSLDRSGVLNEIEETLGREARDGGATYLIPITLDDYVFSWAPDRADLAQAIRDRVVADFRNADHDAAVFDTALGRLLAELTKHSPSP